MSHRTCELVTIYSNNIYIEFVEFMQRALIYGKYNLYEVKLWIVCLEDSCICLGLFCKVTVRVFNALILAVMGVII